MSAAAEPEPTARAGDADMGGLEVRGLQAGGPEAGGPEAGGPDAVDQAWRRAVGGARARGLTARARRRPRWQAGSRIGGLFSGDTVTSGTGPDSRDPQLLGDLTSEMIAHQGWQDDITVAGVMARWSEVVGEDVARACVPETFVDGVLVVRAATTAWATQLRYLVGDLTRRMAEVVGPGVVDRVDVIGPAAPSWRHGPWRTPYGRGARDTYG